MVRHDHAVENCLFRACRLVRHVRHLSLHCVRSAADIGSVPWYGIKRAGRSRSENLPRRAMWAWKLFASTSARAFSTHQRAPMAFGALGLNMSAAWRFSAQERLGVVG